MKVINCKKCNQDSVKGYITDINPNFSELCFKCYNKEYYKKNKQKFLDAANKRYNKNKEECLKGMKEYAKKNKKKLRNYQQNYYEKNREELRRQMTENYKKNGKQYNLDAYIKKKEKFKENPKLKFIENLRTRQGRAVKHHKGTKCSPSLELLGADIETVRAHLESQFKDGMTWENHGLNGWHVDHIIPCCEFDLSKPEEQKKCFHYTNLQPLWAKDNLSKGGRTTKEMFSLHQSSTTLGYR